jgi:protein-S-isoprenylcysteine O-methyltransferase Ste14
MHKDPAGEQASDSGTAGVIARPPLLFLGALLLGFGADRLLPLDFVVPGDALARWTIGGVVIVVGVALMVTGIRAFQRASTPVPTNQATRALVTSGIHGWTRNPIYLGMFLIYGGIGVATHSAWVLILTLPLAVLIRYGVVAREEDYLERRFGDAYLDYKRRVRRWF